MTPIRYSGQYAAAQLDKLPLPYSLQLEVAEYIGHHDLDLLLPPTYLTFARMLGRLPTDAYYGNADFRVRAFEYELSNYRGVVNARCMTMRGRRLVSGFVRAPLGEIRERNPTNMMIYEIDFYVEHTRDDLEFFRMWRGQNTREWPYAHDYGHHKALRRPICRYSRFQARYEEHAAFASTIINRYNNALNVFRSFWNADGEYGIDSDSD